LPKKIGYISMFIAILMLLLIVLSIVNITKREVKIREYKLLASSLNAREVLEKHLQLKKEKDEKLLKATMTHHNLNTKLHLGNIATFEVLDIEEKGSDELAQRYLNNINPYDVTSFNVKYRVEYTKEQEENSGIYSSRYIVIKEYIDSPWQIYIWGVTF